MNKKDCLFDTWQTVSAPMFHTSTMWPVFDESSVKEFLEGTMGAPRQTMPANLEKINAAQSAIETFLLTIKNAQEVCAEQYRAFENERLLLLDTIRQASQQKDVSAQNDRLYGNLDALHYDDGLSFLVHSIKSVVPNGNEVTFARQKLLDWWTDVVPSDVIREKFEYLEALQKDAAPIIKKQYAFLQILLDQYSPKEMIAADQVASLLGSALETLFGTGSAGWTAQLVDGAPNVHIDYEKRAIVVPQGRSYAKEHVQALVVHELGVHVQRSINGESSAERLSAVGMVGYGPSEEALGVLLESSLHPAPSRIQSFVPIAIIDFAKRHGTKKFRDIYDLVYALILCMNNPDDARELIKKKDYERSAYARTLRLLRLGTGEVVDRSATKYWQGLLALNKYFFEHTLDENEINELLIGKYDGLNPIQKKLIKNHKII